jgi:hypothetical protein
LFLFKAFSCCGMLFNLFKNPKVLWNVRIEKKFKKKSSSEIRNSKYYGKRTYLKGKLTNYKEFFFPFET